MKDDSARLCIKPTEKVVSLNVMVRQIKVRMPRSFFYSPLYTTTPLMSLSHGRSGDRVSSSLSFLLVVIKKIIESTFQFLLSRPLADEWI